MREILFRGQTRRIGEKLRMDGTPIDSNWVYGGVFQGDGDLSIIYSYDSVKKYIVYAETVGQYTGKTDKNGKKIFEGDIVEGKGSQAKTDRFLIRWNAAICGFSAGEGKRVRPNLNQATMSAYETIGNIYDNPELLEGGTE